MTLSFSFFSAFIYLQPQKTAHRSYYEVKSETNFGQIGTTLYDYLTLHKTKIYTVESGFRRSYLRELCTVDKSNVPNSIVSDLLVCAFNA